MLRFRRTIIAAVIAAVASGAAMAEAQPKSAFDFTFTAIDGKPMPLAPLKGRVLLVVNVASFCGFTPQYKALEALQSKYEGKGFDVIGVPSNDFNQETEGEAEIKKFCEGMYGVTFPLTQKYAVTGDAAHPFYQWARNELGWLNAPKWNFHKYLVGRDGRLVTSFFSTTAPDSSGVMGAIDAELAKSAPPTATN
ncbi:MAG: glutathione peroxidase [Hyphomicrobium sp.]